MSRKAFSADTRGLCVRGTPLVIYLHDLADGNAHAGFNRDAQALAALGFGVAEVNYRGSAGLGLAFRDAMKESPDRIPVEDVKATAEWIALHYKVDSEKTAVVGKGYGGYLALRALQIYPDSFRCAVTFNSPGDPAAWYREAVIYGGELTQVGRDFFVRSGGTLSPVSIAKSRQPLASPALLIVAMEPIPDVDGNLSDQTNTIRRAAKLTDGREIEILRSPKWDWWSWQDWNQVYLSTGQFLDKQLYDYGVEIGPMKAGP